MTLATTPGWYRGMREPKPRKSAYGWSVPLAGRESRHYEVTIERALRAWRESVDWALYNEELDAGRFVDIGGDLLECGRCAALVRALSYEDHNAWHDNA